MARSRASGLQNEERECLDMDVVSKAVVSKAEAESKLDVTRRDLFRILGSSMVLTGAGSGVLSPALAQHVHIALADAKSLSSGPNYQPKCFTKHNFQTLKKLADIVI